MGLTIVGGGRNIIYVAAGIVRAKASHGSLPDEKVRAPSFGTRTSAAYFLGVISAGRYREISKPAGT
jgi:hypothetical protein